MYRMITVRPASILPLKQPLGFLLNMWKVIRKSSSFTANPRFALLRVFVVDHGH